MFGYFIRKIIRSTRVEEYTIPYIVGMSIDEVRQKYEPEGYTINQISSEYNADYEEGKIITQDPVAETKTTSKIISVTVSKGTKLVKVTNQEGKDIKVAKYELENTLGFIVEQEDKVSDTVAKGIVISQDYKDEDKLIKTSNINGACSFTFRKLEKGKYKIKVFEKIIRLMKENNIDINNVICHAPYIVNLGNKSDLDKWKFSIDFIRGELSRCDQMGITKMVLHPGNAIGITPEEGINNIIEAVNTILDGTTKCKILFETMAGKGTECGRTTDEIAALIKGVNKKDQIGVCLDTCHLFDGGYDLTKFDDYLDEFDSKVGLKYIECIHVNDSKNEIGSHKDRHENIGFGNIGFDTLWII